MSIELSKITEGLDEKPNWATKPRVFINWIRLVGHEYDLDVDKFILGRVLINILGDDANCFGPVEDYQEELQELYKMSKENLIKRVEWESEVPELAEVIKDRLKDFLPSLEESDWTKEDEYISIREEWRENILYFTENLMKENIEYREAERYVLETTPRLIHDWKDIELRVNGLYT